ncbi:MAG: ABC transporter permease [Promethearchaeota archaeon]
MVIESSWLNQIIFRNSVVLEISIKRFLKDRKTLLLAIVGFLPTILAYLWSNSKNWNADILDFRYDYITLVDGIYVTWIILLFCLIFAISALKDEEESKTLSYLLTRPLRRFEIYIAKFIAFEAIAISLSIVCMFPSYLVMALGRSVETIFTEFALFLGASFVVIVEITFYGAIFMLLSVLLSRPLIPALLLGFFERLLTGVLAIINLGPFTPHYHLAAIGNALIPYGPYIAENTSTGLQSLLLLSLISAAVIVVGLIVMKNKDFP